MNEGVYFDHWIIVILLLRYYYLNLLRKGNWTYLSHINDEHIMDAKCDEYLISYFMLEAALDEIMKKYGIARFNKILCNFIQNSQFT